MDALSTKQSAPSEMCRMTQVGLKLFFNLAAQWGLNQVEQAKLLGIKSRTTLNNWKKKVRSNEGVSVSLDTLDRLSLIAGIRKAVELLFPKDRWVDYMKSPNRAFCNKTPLQVMLGGRIEELYRVRRYLDANRGAHFE